MKFSGWQKTSLIDFPNRVASVLFTPGCNLRCPFCHNWRIVVDPKPPFLSEENVLCVLEERKRFVDSVVLSGGEPTIFKDLPEFLKKLKDHGFLVKLDTNGFDSKMLEKCLPYLDYVAVDIKTSPRKYTQLGASDTSELIRSIEILKTNKAEHEFRTTLVPGLVEREDMLEIFELIKGAQVFALQRFVPEDTLAKEWSKIEPYPSQIMSEFAENAQKYAESVVLRA
jgi:pyruvate formate lyase activating enzyme